MAPTAEEEEAAGIGGGHGAAAVEALLGLVADVSALPDNRGPFRRMCCDLARRVKLLAPLFDELGDDADSLGPAEIRGLETLCAALLEAKDVLRFVNEGSKLYQVLRPQKFEQVFRKVTESIEKALGEICLDKLNVSVEVKEQIELVHSQLCRAKESTDSLDLQLNRDLNWAISENHCDPTILKRILEKLQLKNKNDIMRESVALHEMVISGAEDPDVSVEEMSSLLKKLKDFVISENSTSASIEKKTSFAKHRSPVIPDDFRCPISLELMKDPVIVSTGQTYERSYIQKWLDSGHKTCPKTQQTLSHATLTPNFVLKSLIAQWCDANGIELPKKQGSCQESKPGNSSDCNRAGINVLLQRLANGNQEEQRAAAGELRLLAKRNADNRICIAEAGAIPILVQLLSSPDPRTQEHAVTALLNLSINEDNKGLIVKAKAIPKIVEVLESESMEARENAAAALFSLSVVDQNKVLIGEAGAIPALINLLCHGSPRGKKDAATAIFNLCIFKGNKVIAVKAGIVVYLIRMLVDPSGGMVDEALAILAILASSQEGKTAITHSNPIPLMVKLMKTGSARVRENAAALLFSLCGGDEQQLRAAVESGAEEALKDLMETGTERAKRKASSLLGLIRQTADSSNGGCAET
ncbi:U-box domain-containing protein 12-like isoform X1 [Musa acuminata AAA Group]|uniref:U-box domain-containing protein 12-like isoform X1 n=1 Tax=Musa acuminata AAA Group TaxID=214697 RepID=UPI0031E0C040